MFRGNPNWTGLPSTIQRVTADLRIATHHGFSMFFPGLLDVGSCYGAWDSLAKSLALDLAPAAPNVWQADFLQLQIEENLE